MKFTLLDPLRGLAALWVLTFHYPFGPWLEHSSPHVAALFHVGALGVPLFFVISGYCITGSARQSLASDQSPLKFAYRRFRRVYPTYWFSLIPAIAMPFWLQAVSMLKTGVFVPPPDSINNGFMHYSVGDWLSVVTLTRVFATVPNATSLQFKFTSLNAVYWTLALEVQFYLVVGVAMYFRGWFYRVLALVTAAGVAAMFVPQLYLVGVFLPYWPMFAIGAVLYWLIERGIRLPAPTTALRIGLIVATAAAIGLGGTSYLALGGTAEQPAVALVFGVWLWVVFPIDGFVTKWRRAQIGTPGRVLRAGVFALGNMSYSLYLVHTKLIWLAQQPITQVLHAGSPAADILVVLATCVGSYVFYWFAERPYASPAARRATVVVPAVSTAMT